VRWGITPAPVIPLLVDRIGSRALGRLALTGERFGAREALPPQAGARNPSGGRTRNCRRPRRPKHSDGDARAVSMTQRLVAEAVETPDTSAFRERIVTEAANRRCLAEAAEGIVEFRREAVA
jgi:enoyl-CoA hydratase/carnithine racemase